MSIFASGRRSVLAGIAAGIVATLAGQAKAISQSGEQKDMRRVGHVDLQGRPAYQPNFVVYPDGRTIAFVGTHGGSKPNPLKPGSPVEFNGTMIIDATDPSRPVETAHIPVPLSGGQAQMVRPCNGLPGGVPRHVYLLRNIQGSAASGYELWDVTDVKNPAPVAALTGIRNTHKDWIECSTGIAYMPGSRAVDNWRQGQSMVIYDWSNPPLAKAPGSAIPNYGAAYPKYIRTFGLPGGQPGSTGAPAPSLHGAISAFEHPNATRPLARAPDVIGNRIYAAYGVGDDGVLQIINRAELLSLRDPKPAASHPMESDLLAPQAGILYMSPDQGGHTSFPVFGLTPKSYRNFTEFLTRDIVMLASESTADKCQEAPHWSFVVDVTVENSKTFPPATRAMLEQNPWQGPMVLSTLSLDPHAGEKYPRGNYCLRGARFGVHSSEENFRNPYYGRLTFVAYFTGGVRAWDIREPQAPVEVAFYVPESNANTDPDGYMTNNLEVDDRGYIYATDRNGAGLDILELHGQAKAIGLGN
jgi:hypothetical protein